MKLDGSATSDLALMPARARALEEAGYDGLLPAETAHDPESVPDRRNSIQNGEQKKPRGPAFHN